MLWRIGVGVVIIAAVLWLALVAFLLVARPGRGTLSEGLRILPDVTRLLRRLSADRGLLRAVRIRLWLLLGYPALPLDLVPVIGYADDVIITVVVLRSVVRRAGPDPTRSAATGRARMVWRRCHDWPAWRTDNTNTVRETRGS